MCVCVSALWAIKNYSRERKSLVPFSFSVRHLLSILLMGGALVTYSASCFTSKEEQRNAVFAVHYTVKAV